MKNSIGVDDAIGTMAARVDLGKGLFESLLKVERELAVEVTHVLV